MATREGNKATPNRRGAKSRVIVLEAAERIMASHGFEAATVAALVAESGVPASSIYHYFGNKDGVLLAVMETGAERFFASVAPLPERGDDPAEYLAAMLDRVVKALNEQPNFLRLLIVMAAQPSPSVQDDVHEVVGRVRSVALQLLRAQLGEHLDLDDAQADAMARFALAHLDGAFIAHQADPTVQLADLTRHLPTALLAIRDSLNAA
jgi:AcrR family transcriptional regulator